MRRAFTSMAAGLLLTLTTLGCSPQPGIAPLPTDEAVTLDRIPEGVMEAARQRLPGVDLQEARILRSDGGLSYEIRGRTAEGRTRGVKVSASGQVLAEE